MVAPTEVVNLITKEFIITGQKISDMSMLHALNKINVTNAMRLGKRQQGVKAWLLKITLAST